MDTDFDSDDEQIVSSTTSALLYKKRKNETSAGTQNKKRRNLDESAKSLIETSKFEHESIISNACHVMKNPINDINKFEKAELILIIIAYSDVCIEDLANWDTFFTKICRYDWNIKIRYAFSQYFVKCPCISTLLKNNREIKNIQSPQVFQSSFNEIYLNKIKHLFSSYKPNINDQQQKRQCINLKKVNKK